MISVQPLPPRELPTTLHTLLSAHSPIKVARALVGVVTLTKSDKRDQLLRIYDELDDIRKQELLRLAMVLLRSK
jgi:hypothetical protein